MTTQHETATYEVGEMSVKEYVNIIAKTLENLQLKGIIPQTISLDFKICNIHPGEWVLVKDMEKTIFNSTIERSFSGTTDN